jgi:adenylate cyclase
MARHGRGWNDNPDPEEDFQQAGKLAREAMADPSAPPMTRTLVHIALVYVSLGERRFDQALAEAEALLALAPYDGTLVYHMAEPTILAGQPKRALEWIERAAALYPEDDPRQPLLRSVKAYALFADGKPDEALDALRDIRGMLPGFLLLRARLLVGLGRVDEARADVRKFLEYEPSYSQAKHRRKYFYLDPAHVERSIQVFAIAGLPED